MPTDTPQRNLLYKLPTKWFLIILFVIVVVGGGLVFMISQGHMPFVRYSGIMLNSSTRECSEYTHFFWIDSIDKKFPTPSGDWTAYAIPEGDSYMMRTIELPGLRECPVSNLRGCCEALGYTFE